MNIPEEPKKCACPYCPGHGEHYGAVELQLEQVQPPSKQMTFDELWDAAGLSARQDQDTLNDFWTKLGVPFNAPQGRGYIPK